jgi:hypothetical protein
LSNPIVHHSVAQHVLRRFCDSRGTLWTYDKLKGKIYPGDPPSQACEKHFYSIIDKSGTRNPVIETKFLKHIDSKGKRAVDELLSQKRLTTETALNFMCFAAAQMLRVETYFGRLEGWLSPMLQEIAKRMPNDPKFRTYATEGLREAGASDTDIDRLFAGLRRGEFKITANREYCKTQLFETFNKVVSLFCQMDWRFLRIEDAVDRFLISDNPLVLEDIGQGESQPLGIANPNIEITMPLSPTVVATACWNGVTDYGVIARQSIDTVNQRTIDQANRFVYAPFRSEGLLAQVVESQGKQARTTIERIKLGKGSLLVASFAN